MELQERINILTQGVELAQKKGVLTLNDAYYAKQALDALNNNVSLKEAFIIMNKTVNIGQKNGIYSLRDSHFLYLALENYESVIITPASTPTPQVSTQSSSTTPTDINKEQSVSTPKQGVTSRKTKKES